MELALTIAPWLFFLGSAFVFIHFLFLSVTILTVSVTMAMTVSDGVLVNKINLDSRSLWLSFVLAVIGTILLFL